MKENPLVSASFWRLSVLPKAAVGGSYRKEVFSVFTHFLFFPCLNILICLEYLLQEWLSAPSFLFTALGMLIVFLTPRGNPQVCMLKCCSTIPWVCWVRLEHRACLEQRLELCNRPWEGWMRIAQSTAWCLLACGLSQLIFILLWAHGVHSYQTPLQGAGSLRWGYVLGTHVNILLCFYGQVNRGLLRWVLMVTH